MITAFVHTTSRLPTAHAGSGRAGCALGHTTHCGTCSACQQAQALRYSGQLQAAALAGTQWRQLPPSEKQRRQREHEDLHWASRIGSALDERRLVLHAQPIIDLRSRESVRHELLVRMVDHDGTIIPPGRFLPAAERYGLIEDIDRWVIVQATQLAAQGLKVHFNISGKSLGSRALLGDLARTVHDTGADPAMLVCEITAAALAADQAIAQRFVRDFAALGGGVALDDLAGLDGLRRLPLTTLKIGPEVVGDLLGNHDNQRLVEQIVDLAREARQKTLVLGVEAGATLSLLQDYGVDYAQGFSIGHPVPVETLLAPARSLPKTPAQPVRSTAQQVRSLR